MVGNNINPFSIQGNNYLLTGAASGIGRAASILLSKLGANLILIDVNSDGLKETKSGCKESDQMLVLDLTKPSLIRDSVVARVSGFGKLNGLVHLAGIPYISPLKTISEEKCAEVYTVNTYSAIELAKVF